MPLVPTRSPTVAPAANHPSAHTQSATTQPHAPPPSRCLSLTSLLTTPSTTLNFDNFNLSRASTRSIHYLRTTLLPNSRPPPFHAANARLTIRVHLAQFVPNAQFCITNGNFTKRTKPQHASYCLTAICSADSAPIALLKCTI